MKTTRPNSLVVLMIVFLALLSFAPAYSAAVEKTSTLSKKDLKGLLKNARTPAEQRTIAEYYRQDAERLTASSKKHAELAEVYAKNPPFPALEAKHGDAFGQGASHCRKWAKLDAEQADKTEKLAVLHEDMARKAELKAADSQPLAPVAWATTVLSMGK
jgi:hypothetical protein